MLSSRASKRRVVVMLAAYFLGVAELQLYRFIEGQLL